MSKTTIVTIELWFDGGPPSHDRVLEYLQELIKRGTLSYKFETTEEEGDEDDLDETMVYIVQPEAK